MVNILMGIFVMKEKLKFKFYNILDIFVCWFFSFGVCLCGGQHSVGNNFHFLLVSNDVNMKMLLLNFMNSDFLNSITLFVHVICFTLLLN